MLTTTIIITKINSSYHFPFHLFERVIHFSSTTSTQSSSSQPSFHDPSVFIVIRRDRSRSVPDPSLVSCHPSRWVKARSFVFFFPRGTASPLHRNRGNVLFCHLAAIFESRNRVRRSPSLGIGTLDPNNSSNSSSRSFSIRAKLSCRPMV